jgi:hypothetical protein
MSPVGLLVGVEVLAPVEGFETLGFEVVDCGWAVD